MPCRPFLFRLAAQALEWRSGGRTPDPMRPVLLQLPSKLLFFVALVLAAVTFVRDRQRRRKDPKAPPSSNPLYLVLGAWALLAFRGGSWVPVPAAFSHPWLPVPIHSYGVMLG